MHSFRASTDGATVYAITDTESAAAWREAGAEVVVDDEATTFAKRANIGYRETRQPWLFLVGDDVRFHPRWLLNAQLVASNRRHVVGTNDLCNPRVISGEHGTHLLIRRSYVDAVGGSWDGPGAVAHEGYRHWYVDDEIVLAAKRRGVWASASSSVVAHLHPLFGTGETDAVYELGQSHADTDKALFGERLAQYAG